jgi:integrase
MIDRYIRDVLPTKSKRKAYLSNQKAQLNWWRARLQMPLAEIGKSEMAEGRDELAKRYEPATVNKYLSALSHVFTVAINEWEWLEASPLTGLRRLKEPKGRNRFLSKEHELNALLASCMLEKKPLYLICLLEICAGPRKCEILKLEKSKLYLDTGLAIVDETKNDESASFHFTGLALEELRKYARTWHPRSKLVFPNRFGDKPMSIDREFRRARDRAKIENFHFHDLRHTHASYLAMHGGSLKVLQESLRHKSLDMVLRYAHLSPSHLASEIKGMTENVFQNINQGDSHAA